MCEMFGVSARKPAAVNDLLREFFSHSERHGNGWGMAVFRGGLVSVEKEPVQAIHSDYLRERLRNRIEERSMIAHIRLANLLLIAAEGIIPAAVIGTEDQHHGRGGDKRLVVAADGQSLLHFPIGDIQDGIQRHIARRGSLNGGFQNSPLSCVLNGTVFIDPDGLPGMELTDYFVHSASSAAFFSSLGRTKGLQTTSQRLMGVPRAWNFSS